MRRLSRRLLITDLKGRGDMTEMTAAVKAIGKAQRVLVCVKNTEVWVQITKKEALYLIEKHATEAKTYCLLDLKWEGGELLLCTYDH